jgi:hypothetical protein
VFTRLVNSPILNNNNNKQQTTNILKVELLCVSMDVITEMLQGPCPGNQECVTNNEASLHAIDKTLRGEIHKRVNKGLRLKVKVKARVLLASMLEVR